MGDAAELFSQIYEAMDGLKTELQAAKDRASTSYREGYEAGKAESYKAGYTAASVACIEEHARRDRNRPVLASNPLDPKCASIFEAAEMLASVTAAMRKLADALEAMQKRAEWAEAAAKGVQAVHGGEWCKKNREEGRGACGMCAACCEEWREKAEKAEAAEKTRATIRASRDHYQRTAWEQEAELMQLRDRLRELDAWKNEARGLREERDHALERAERAEKMLTTERRA
jgi:hypothetical protein